LLLLLWSNTSRSFFWGPLVVVGHLRNNDGCRRRSGPLTSNQSGSASLDRYMGWTLNFWPSSDDKNSPQGVTLQVGLMHQLPSPPAICLMGQHWWVDVARWPRANKGEGWVALKAATSEFYQGSSRYLTHDLLEKVRVK
jgi:hypothetical protein